MLIDCGGGGEGTRRHLDLQQTLFKLCVLQSFVFMLIFETDESVLTIGKSLGLGKESALRHF